MNKTEESYILLFVGLGLLIFNKYFAQVCQWGQEEVVKIRHYNLWFYRLPALLIGFIFIFGALFYLSN